MVSIPTCDGLGGKRGRDGDRLVVAEFVVPPAYVDEYTVEGKSLKFAEVAYERHLTSGTDLHGIRSFVSQRRILCGDGCEEMSLEIPGS